MTQSPDSREARARDCLAEAVSPSWRQGIRSGQNNDWGHIKPSEAIRAMLAFATAEQQHAPDSNLQKTQSAPEQQRIGPGEVRELLERCATALNVLSAMCFVANLNMGADTATEMRNEILAALSPDTAQTKALQTDEVMK